MAKNLPRWDIFCKIVDNYGDIGVCWRLAKQLVAEHHIQVRLWIDDLLVAKKVIPALTVKSTTQIIDNVQIVHWQSDSTFEEVADVVIEAFGCGLPSSYLTKMQPENLWINLEYLSAEHWVESFHGRHAVHGDLKRYFYFPGFTVNTGGLIREQHLSESSSQGLSRYDDIAVSLFCYKSAPVDALLDALSASRHKVVLYVPINDDLPRLAAHFGKDALNIGDSLTMGALTLNVLPFLTQDEYDALLASCDINFVRGEDSWIRAVWTGKPMIWQPYVQEEGAHFNKLDAFLNLFYADCRADVKAVIFNLHKAWSDGSFNKAEHWDQVLDHLTLWQQYTKQQCSNMFNQPDLASKLVIFCNNL